MKQILSTLFVILPFILFAQQPNVTSAFTSCSQISEDSVRLNIIQSPTLEGNLYEWRTDWIDFTKQSGGSQKLSYAESASHEINYVSHPVFQNTDTSIVVAVDIPDDADTIKIMSKFSWQPVYPQYPYWGGHGTKYIYVHTGCALNQDEPIIVVNDTILNVIEIDYYVVNEIEDTAPFQCVEVAQNGDYLYFSFLCGKSGDFTIISPNGYPLTKVQHSGFQSSWTNVFGSGLFTVYFKYTDGTEEVKKFTFN